MFNFIKSLIISLSLFSSSFNSKIISFIFEEVKGIEINIEFVSSINAIFSFSNLSDNYSQISFKSSN